MKIAQVVCTYPPYRGGIGNVAKEYTKGLTKLGHIVQVFTPLYNQRFKHSSDNISRIKPILKYGNGAFLPTLLFKLRKFDSIIFHYPFFGTAEVLWLYLFFKPKKQKIFIYYHMDVINNSFLFKLLSIPSKLTIKTLFKRADAVFCSSFDYLLHSDIKKLYQAHSDKFYELPFGVDTSQFKPHQKSVSDKIKILFVGGLDRAHYFKGLNNLLIAFSRLKGSALELKIVGNGELLPLYQKKCRQLACDSRVEFAIQVSNEDLLVYYQQADIFVLPSINRCEAFGLVLLEAMASATPVVASDLPGVRKVFTDGEEGLIVKTNNIDDLVEKLQRLVDSQDMRDKMAQKAKILVDKQYSWKVVIKRLHQLITNSNTVV